MRKQRHKFVRSTKENSLECVLREPRPVTRWIFPIAILDWSSSLSRFSGKSVASQNHGSEYCSTPTLTNVLMSSKHFGQQRSTSLSSHSPSRTCVPSLRTGPAGKWRLGLSTSGTMTRGSSGTSFDGEKSSQKFGQVPKRPKGSRCKRDGLTPFPGSNPGLPIFSAANAAEKMAPRLVCPRFKVGKHVGPLLLQLIMRVKWNAKNDPAVFVCHRMREANMRGS